jgi:sugar lactone lactonase YvrE
MRSGSFRRAFALASTLLFVACDSGQPTAPSAIDGGATTTSASSLRFCLFPVCRILSDLGEELYVADEGEPNGTQSGVTVYSTRANGNVAPVRTITGPGGGLAFPRNVAVDGSGRVYVVNQGITALTPSITIYARDANGAAIPVDTIQGKNTGLAGPCGIAVDDAGKIYVCNGSLAQGVLIFAAGASGNASPMATIGGSNTNIVDPTDIALDGAGNIYVTTQSSDGVLVFAPGSNGNVSPARFITGSNTGMFFPTSLAVDRTGAIYVTSFFGTAGFDTDNGSVNVYAPGANGNVAPVDTIEGGNTGLIGFGPLGIALDPSGNIFVSIQSTINVYAAHAHGNVAPVASITGSSTGLINPIGIAIASVSSGFCPPFLRACPPGIPKL